MTKIEWSNWSYKITVEFLEIYGYSILNKKKTGSHFAHYNAEKDIILTVSIPHKKDIMAVGTMKGIADKSGIAKEEWLKYKDNPRKYKKGFNLTNQ